MTETVRVNVQDLRDAASEEWHQYDPAPVTAVDLAALLDVAEAAQRAERAFNAYATAQLLGEQQVDAPMREFVILNEALARLDFGGPQ